MMRAVIWIMLGIGIAHVTRRWLDTTPMAEVPNPKDRNERMYTCWSCFKTAMRTHQDGEKMDLWLSDCANEKYCSICGKRLNGAIVRWHPNNKKRGLQQMILGDRFINSFIRKGYIQNTLPECVGPGSLDVRLGNTFLTIESGDPIELGSGGATYKKTQINDFERFVLHPGDFVLATTMERLNLPKHVSAFVQGRSSVGRIAMPTQNAGFIDPGFRGEITLEIVNDSNRIILLTPGFRVAQFVFEYTLGVSRPYNGKYQGQAGATGSKIYIDRR